MSKTVKSYFFLILSAILYGLSAIVSKVLFANGGTPVAAMLGRCFLCVPFYCVGSAVKKINMRLTKKEFKDVCVLAVCGSICTSICTLYAALLLPAGTSSSIHYLYCMFALLECVLIFRERFDGIKALCVVMSIVGVFLLYAQTDFSNASRLGMVIALASAVFWATYSVYMEKSGACNMPGHKLQLYTHLFAGIVCLLFLAATGKLAIGFNRKAWIIAIIYYGVVNSIAHILFQLGVSAVGSQISCILSTAEPLTSVILGILFFQEKFSLRIAFGVIIVLVASAMVSIHNENVKKKAAETACTEVP